MLMMVAEPVVAAGTGAAGFLPDAENATEVDGTSAQLRFPQGIAVEPSGCGGRLIIADAGNSVSILHSVSILSH